MPGELHVVVHVLSKMEANQREKHRPSALEKWFHTEYFLGEQKKEELNE